MRVGAGGGFHPGLSAARPALPSPHLRSFVVDGAGPGDALAAPYRHPRGGIPGCEFTIDLNELTAAGLVNSDYWIRYSLTAMIFAGVFDRYPRLRVGSVEHETAWIPHWLKQMDFTYRERPTLTRGWKSRQALLPSDYWHRNMFVEFMEDDYGVRLRDVIGVDNMLWGNDFLHAESTWPMSRAFLDRIFAGVPEVDQHKITTDNAAKLFRFSLS